MKSSILTLLGFILFLTGFIALVLGIVNLDLQILKFLRSFSGTTQLISKLIMLFGGMVLFYLGRTAGYHVDSTET